MQLHLLFNGGLQKESFFLFEKKKKKKNSGSIQAKKPFTYQVNQDEKKAVRFHNKSNALSAVICLFSQENVL